MSETVDSPESDLIRRLARDLLWLRNHYADGDPALKALVLSRIDVTLGLHGVREVLPS